MASRVQAVAELLEEAHHVGDLQPARDVPQDQAIDRLIALLTDSGVVSAAGNRRALRSGEEPLEQFRRYMAVYAREQAVCHFSPALIANLEKHWDAANRSG